MAAVQMLLARFSDSGGSDGGSDSGGSDGGFDSGVSDGGGLESDGNGRK